MFSSYKNSIEEAETTLLQTNVSHSNERKNLKLKIEDQKTEIEDLTLTLEGQKMTNMEDLQKQNAELTADLAKHKKALTDHKEKAKKLIKAQQIKVKLLQSELENVPKDSGSEELKNLQEKLDERNKLIEQMQNGENKSGDDMATELATVQDELKGRVRTTRISENKNNHFSMLSI